MLQAPETETSCFSDQNVLSESLQIEILPGIYLYLPSFRNLGCVAKILKNLGYFEFFANILSRESFYKKFVEIGTRCSPKVLSKQSEKSLVCVL